VLLIDYPGLTSRTALEAVRHLPTGSRDITGLIEVVRPPWLLLRPSELEGLRSRYPTTAARYEVVRRVGSPRDEVERGGYAKATVDGEFIILRRIP